MALHGGQFSGPAYDTLVEGTIRSTILNVAKTFREDNRPNPTQDKDGELRRLLSRQFRAFRNDDPNPIQQKGIPVCILRKATKNKATGTQKAATQLAIGAFFDGMRSCEYLKIPQAEKRRTDILQLGTVRFFRKGRELNHNNP